MDTAVIDDYMRVVGSDPEDTFRTKLDDLGSKTIGPDSAGQYSSNCPAHNDIRPSLRWFKTANSTVKFHCHSGCEYGDILKAMGLRGYQLKPVRYEFDYYDHEGTYRFTVKRSQTANDEKKFTQYRRAAADDGGDLDGNGLGDDESLFWLEPELEVAAEDARSRGVKIRLWIPEGEKDTVAIAGSGSLEDWDFVTTAPQGARGWKPFHTQRISNLFDRGALGELTIIADPDPGGMRRGFELRDLLGEAVPDLPVKVLTVEPGHDIADLCDEYGRRWLDQTRELSESEITEALEEGTAVSGFMTRLKIGVGAKAGRRGMAIASNSEKDGPRMVIAAEIEPVSAWSGGWIVRVTGPRRDPHEVVLTRSDLASKSSFDRWLVRDARVGMVPRCGIGAGEVAQALGMWLEWACDVRGVKQVVVTEHLTWVDPVTGEPAKFAGPPSLGDRQPVWVSPDPDAGSDVRWVGSDRAGSTWGHERDELATAWAWARAVTFGDERSVAAVAGWAAAMILAPWLGRWLATKPGLAVIAPSGSGKTHGASRLILQLVGCDGNSTSSVAALRRRLAQGGVSAIQWVDDSAILDDHHLKEILRVATSQGDHSLANPDAGATATQSAKLTGCIVVSAEGVAWAEEVAMQDRFLFVRPDNPQGRLSERSDREGELQWGDVVELTQEFPTGALTEVAGWSVAGLVSEEILELIPQWIAQIGTPKGRGDVGPWCAAIGARAVATWLTRARSRAGDDWPGKTSSWASKRYNNWGWLVREADELLAEAKSTGSRFNTLVNEVIPSVLNAELHAVSGKGMTSLVVEHIDALDADRFRSSVHRAVQHGKDLATAMPLVAVDVDGRIWVWIQGAAAWYERVHRGKAEQRITGLRALTDQSLTVVDCPGWAQWTEHKDGGRQYTRYGIRVGKRDAGRNRATYIRLNAEASAKILEGVGR